MERETNIKLKRRSVSAEKNHGILQSITKKTTHLPRAISVQLLKFFEIDRFESKMIVRKFPQIPIAEIMITYGKESRSNVLSTLRIVLCSPEVSFDMIEALN